MMGFFSYGTLGWLFWTVDDMTNTNRSGNEMIMLPSVSSSWESSSSSSMQQKQQHPQEELDEQTIIAPQKSSVVTDRIGRNAIRDTDNHLRNLQPRQGDYSIGSETIATITVDNDGGGGGGGDNDRRMKRQQHSTIQNQMRRSSLLLVGGSTGDATHFGEEQRSRTRLNDEGFGWMVFPACLVVIIYLEAKYRVNDDNNHHGNNERRSRRRRRWGPSTSFVPLTTRMGFPYGPNLGIDHERIQLEDYDHRRTTSILNTLAMINQDRLERGEPTVSLESYLSFQRVLSDRSIWMNIAERYQLGFSAAHGRNGNLIPPGISLERLEALCPKWTINLGKEHDHSDNVNRHKRISIMKDIMNEECSICLSHYEVEDTMRSLPCHHMFHSFCIDRWMEQSSFCPMCKAPVERTPHYDEAQQRPHD
jgi:hypothetical protein